MVVDKSEIVARIAQERRVETMVENIAKSPLTPDLKDLSQMVYLILLEYDEGKLRDLWDNGQINFFIARIILNQYRSANSPFYKLFRKQSVNRNPLFDIEITYTDNGKGWIPRIDLTRE